VEVPMVALDDVIPNDSKISVIHLDIELYELLALHGAKEIIKRCEPFLILETHKSNPDLMKFLEEIGYEKYNKEKVWRENTIWRKR
jgi:hypothetical protein